MGPSCRWGDAQAGPVCADRSRAISSPVAQSGQRDGCSGRWAALCALRHGGQLAWPLGVIDFGISRPMVSLSCDHLTAACAPAPAPPREGFYGRQPVRCVGQDRCYRRHLAPPSARAPGRRRCGRHRPGLVGQSGRRSRGQPPVLHLPVWRDRHHQLQSSGGLSSATGGLHHAGYQLLRQALQRLRSPLRRPDHDPADPNADGAAGLSGGAAVFRRAVLRRGLRSLPGESGGVHPGGHRLLRGTGLLR